ncbi:MAG TPA: tripartite tricarboxylate transporter TctB family protein [Noviherbaspirillum sp.]|uniref:tripartite tricarboxylate transporter TctB family protein n=1 Tax=Noviherbaspirillum sp. TaxID=1926288 RepID=UPI002D544AB5|nr:tripartite tricarboxylate transporter TctB family protein [Noviherbaspirillum sp.]HYD94951.1 tripartite tricarboxylate transporter TctB family protein [Noviherbaspirillum sp.]
MTGRGAHTLPAWRAPLIVGLVLLVLAALVLGDSLRLAAGVGHGVGPAVGMRLTGALLGVLGVAHLVTAWARRRASVEVPYADTGKPGPLAWVLAGLVLQIAVLAFGGGFILASTILFVCTACAFGRKLLSFGPVYGFVLSLAVYAFFTKVLALTLPTGPLERLLLG